MSKSKARERVTPATEGTEVILMHGYSSAPIGYTVRPKCSEDTGRWICVTHRKVFDNNFGKDSHISGHDGCAANANHVLAWLCAHHGPEVP
jgi:hypothetical protein